MSNLINDKKKYEQSIIGKVICEYSDCNKIRKRGSYYCTDCHMETFRTSVTPYGSQA